MLPFDNVILGGDIIVMRPNKEYNPAYISYAINQQKQQLLTRVTGGVVKHLSGKSLMTVIIPIPKIEEQNQFVTIAKQADKSKFVGFKSQFIEMFGAVNETSTLSSFISETYPGEWGKEDVEKIGIKVLRTTNFQNDGHINFNEVVTRDIEQRKIDKKQLKKGDIILERSGGTADNPVGRVVYFNDEGKYMFNNFTQLLRCNEDVENLYIFYSLFNYYNTNKSGIRSLGNQTTGIQNLKMDKYLDIQIVNAPIDLQKRFVDIYQQADKSKYIN